MTPQTMTQAGKRWKASELRKLPPEQRDAILEAAEEDYRNDRNSNAFEAYGEDDLYGESANSRTHEGLRTAFLPLP